MATLLSSRVSIGSSAPAAALSFFKKLGRIVLALTFVALVSALGSVVILRFAGYLPLVVDGGSMGNSIPNGSLVFTHWISDDDAKLGDVILINDRAASADARPKLHRVISMQALGETTVVETKGDANETPDPTTYILPDRVLTPAYTLPYLGYIVTFAATPLGWVLFIAAPAVMVSLTLLRKIWAPLDKPVAGSKRLT